MSNTINFLNQIKLQCSNELITYVYYNKDDGCIHKISSRNIPTIDYNILEVPTSQAEPLTSGTKQTSDYKVTFDVITKTIQLKEVLRDNKLTVNEKLYRIPDTTGEVDLSIIKDNNKNKWVFTLSDELTYFFTNHSPAPATGLLQFSVTTFDDPNILYRTININVENLIANRIEIPFQYLFETDGTDVSIYTSKYFQLYGFTVL
jgi:hypothetical protein